MIICPAAEMIFGIVVDAHCLTFPPVTPLATDVMLVASVLTRLLMLVQLLRRIQLVQPM
jgi:hypothetical protein